ncbi:MAG: protein phosphatase CheZ [Pseudomonadota bacterium]
MTKNIRVASQKTTDSGRTDEIVRVVESTVKAMQDNPSGFAEKLYREFESLAGFIQKARTEVASLCPEEIRAKHIPSATDELDAIVTATERATGEILDSTEKIEAVFGKVNDEVREALNSAVTNIYEACSFQDITGQRVSKIVTTLKQIEEKLQGLADVFSGHLPISTTEQKTAPREDPMDEKALLHGPQLPGAAKSQEEIDALLQNLD